MTDLATDQLRPDSQPMRLLLAGNLAVDPIELMKVSRFTPVACIASMMATACRVPEPVAGPWGMAA
jgi:hypothetical protein